MLAGRRGRGGAAWVATSTAGASAEDSIVGGDGADGAAGRRSGGGTEDGGGTEEEDGGTIGSKGRFGTWCLEERQIFDPEVSCESRIVSRGALGAGTLAEFDATGT